MRSSHLILVQFMSFQFYKFCVIYLLYMYDVHNDAVKVYDK